MHQSHKEIGDIGSAIAVSNRTFHPIQDAESTEEFTEEYKSQLEKTTQERCSKLLENLGWGNGFRIPFANAENRKLENNLEFKQRKVLGLRSEFNDNSDHVRSLEQHLARIQQDIHAYQAIVNSKQSLIDEESTFLGLAERMHNRVEEDKVKLEKVLKASQQRSEVMQKDFFRRLKNITEVKKLIDFDAKALKDYQRRIQAYEETATDIRKICQEDEKQIRELEEARVDLGARRRELRFQLDREAMNTAKFQEQFDRLSVEFRKVHKQRQEMITMWASTIQAMGGKDDDMKDVADEYYEKKKLLRRLTDSLGAKERRLRNESCGIGGKEMALAELDRHVADIRRRIEEQKSIISALKDACALSQTEIHHAANETKVKLAALAEMVKYMQFFELKYKKAYGVVIELREKLRDIMGGRNDADSRMDELENILAEEEKASEHLLKEMDMLRKHYWERSNDKTVTEGEIRHMETSTSRVLNNLAMMQSKETVNLDFVSKRSGIIYRLDLECSTIENRISRMTNQSVDPKFFELQNQAIELRATYKKVEKDIKYITSELEHVRNMSIKCDMETGKNRRDARILEAELRQCDMLTHGLEKLMDQAVKELHKEHVKHSLERVYLKRLTNELKSERQEMFGLAEIRNTIHWAVRERKAEIENHRVLNSSRQKALTDTVSKLRVQVSEVCFRTEKLMGRYELVTKLMSSSIDANPEEQTMGFQVRKAAHERETIQMELHKWRARLEEAEKELEGINNVFKIMKTSNTSLKDSLSPAPEQSEELQALEELNTQEQEILLRRGRAKKYRAILRDRVQDLEQQLAVIEQEVHATLQLRQVKESLTSKVQNELFRQKEKVMRWTAMCNRLVKEIKERFPEEDYKVIQHDLKLRFTVSKFETSVSMLERILSQYPYLKDFLNHYFRKEMTLMKLYYRFNKLPIPSAAGLEAAHSTRSRTSAEVK